MKQLQVKQGATAGLIISVVAAAGAYGRSGNSLGTALYIFAAGLVATSAIIGVIVAYTRSRS